MRRGAFITIEGAEGVGKSTSLGFIETFLDQRGVEHMLTREPGGTALGEKVRDWILDGEHGALSAEVEALLMFAARSQHLDERIRPALTAGRWVVCDRFTDATFAYQGGGRGARIPFLESLSQEIQHGLTPDLTLLLDAPVEVGFARINDRSHDHFEREDLEFFARVRNAYLSIAEREPARVKIIDASRSIEEVEGQIDQQLETFCSTFLAAAEVD